MAQYEVLLLSAAKRAILAMDEDSKATTADCLRTELDVDHLADVPVWFVRDDYTVRPLSNGWSAIFRSMTPADFRALDPPRRRRRPGTGFAVFDLLSAEEAISSLETFKRALRRGRR